MLNTFLKYMMHVSFLQVYDCNSWTHCQGFYLLRFCTTLLDHSILQLIMDLVCQRGRIRKLIFIKRFLKICDAPISLAMPYFRSEGSPCHALRRQRVLFQRICPLFFLIFFFATYFSAQGGLSQDVEIVPKKYQFALKKKRGTPPAPGVRGYQLFGGQKNLGVQFSRVNIFGG